MTPGETVVREGLPHGRYYAEHVQVVGDDPEAQLLEMLDAKVGKEWHLVGVAGGLRVGGAILFCNTTKFSFGRTDR